jgi:hypothetical protein
VRGRGEFLPSAVGFEQGESVAAVEASGESWNTSTAARRPWERRIVWPPEAVERERADVAERSTGDTDRVIQFNPNAQRGQTAPRDEKPARPKLRFPQEWPGPRQLRRRRSQPFTIGGFAYGCVLGSAAAAMILLVVEIAF